MWGWVTASTALTATAASATVPPDFKTSTPASVASGCAEATMPRRPRARGRCEYPICGTLTSREESGDLVLREDGHGPLVRAVDELHALGRRHDVTDVMAVDALAGERVDDDAGLGGGQREQERARRDGAEWIEAERAAQLHALGQPHDALGVDAQAHAGGLGQLGERGGDAALGRIVHRVDGGQLARDLRLRQHAEPGRAQKALGPADDRGRDPAPAQLGFALARDDGGALEGNALGHHHRVADARAARGHELVLGDFAEHGSGDYDTIEAVRDLGVAADQRNLQLVARLTDLREEGFDGF